MLLLKSFPGCVTDAPADADSASPSGTFAAKLVPIGFGIRKLQISVVIEDAKVESMDAILEEELVRDGESETIQSADIASFNKLVSFWGGPGNARCSGWSAGVPRQKSWECKAAPLAWCCWAVQRLHASFVTLRSTCSFNVLRSACFGKHGCWLPCCTALWWSAL